MDRSVMRGKRLVCKVVFEYWEEKFLILFEGQPIVFCLITVKARILHDTGDRLRASRALSLCLRPLQCALRPDNETFPKKL